MLSTVWNPWVHRTYYFIYIVSLIDLFILTLMHAKPTYAAMYEKLKIKTEKVN